MKKYPITFSNKFEAEYWKDGDRYNKEIAIVKLYDGREMTLSEVEDEIEQMGGQVIFNGVTIEIYNYYIE